ncbi:MAG: hypothetical protein GC181_14135 [Bacteroidetes bacterium]|nr:hypothetical protein [Bacteroidota bacterium]
MRRIEKTAFNFTPILFFIFLVLGISLISFTEENDRFLSVEKLLEAGKINVEITGTGGYQQNCVSFEITNRTSSVLPLKIEAGRRLLSEDSLEQDIFLVHENRFELKPHEKKVVSGFGFCCQSSNHSPHSGSGFKIGFMAPEKWIRLAKYIDQHRDVNTGIQTAVWILSNNHSISGLRYNGSESEKQLLNIVSDLSGQEMPWYFTKYAPDTARAFSDRPVKITGEIPFSLKNNAVVSIVVADAHGRVVDHIREAKIFNRGDYTEMLNLSVDHWPKGKYHIRIFTDYGTCIASKSFSL